MKRVLIIEAQIKRYRKPFYERLSGALRDDGVRLKVVYSPPGPSEAQKNDNCDLPPEYGVKVRGLWFGGERVLFQSAFRQIALADLVIVEQANKFILNHFLLPLSLFRLKKVAYWGLGENLQADRSFISEWYKEQTLDWVQWWFAYTEGTARYLRERGVRPNKITAVQNSVDTRGIQACVRSISPTARIALRAEIGIGPTDPVGIFVGMLHKVKSIPFLIQAGKRIQEAIPEFHLVIVGGGPEEEVLKRMAENLPWVHFVGPRFGNQKSQMLAIADVFLLPGRVGLALLDGFAAGLPVVATRLSIHGPEIEYLADGLNGLVTEPDPEVFSQVVSSLLSDQTQLQRLRQGASNSAKKYSIEAMVERFERGIVRCLARPRLLGSQTQSKAEPGAPQISAVGELPIPASLAPCKIETKRTAERALSDWPINPASNTPRRTLITTSWDDGNPLDLRLAELLSKYGLTGTFYVPRSGQRNVMNESQIRELSRAFEIGGHTMDHRVIDRCSDPDSISQLSGSRDWIEQVTGQSCRVFCFPGGRFRKRQLKLVRQAGFEAVRTVELLSTAHPRCIDGLYVIPTTIQAFPHGPSAYARNALKRFSISAVFKLNNALLSRDWVELARRLFLRTVELGGVFHLWGHSWEIQERQQWRTLEDFLAFIAAHLKAVPCVTNGALCTECTEGIRLRTSILSAARTGAELERSLPRTWENERT